MHHDPLELALSLGVDYEVAIELRNLLAADKTGWTETWLERLNRPDWRATFPKFTQHYLDPATLGHILSERERLSNPFDPDAMRIKRFCELVDAGGVVSVTRIDDGVPRSFRTVQPLGWISGKVK
jgi:hypothetical protein